MDLEYTRDRKCELHCNDHLSCLSMYQSDNARFINKFLAKYIYEEIKVSSIFTCFIVKDP